MGGNRRNLILLFCVIIFAIFIGEIGVYYYTRQGNKGSVSPVTGVGQQEEKQRVIPVRLTLFSDVSGWIPGEWSLADHTLTREISEKTGIAIEASVPAQDADLQLSLLLIKNRLPDLMIIQDPNMVKKLVSSGKVWDLDEFFDEYNTDASVRRAFDPSVRKKMIVRDGGWYCLPAGMNQNDLAGSDISVIWNKELAAKYNITAESVDTVKGFTDVLEKAARDRKIYDKSMIPILLGGSEDNYRITEYFAGCFGAEETGLAMWKEQGGKSALSLINGLLRKNILSPEYLAYSGAQTQDLLNNGKVLCFAGDVSHMDFDQDKWVCFGPVRLDEKTEPVRRCKDQSDAGWPCIMISKGCTDLADTGRFIDFMESGQVVDLIEKYNADYRNWWIYENPLWDICFDENSTWYLHEKKMQLLKDTDSRMKTVEAADAESGNYDFSILAQVISATSDKDFDFAYDNLLNRLGQDR